MYGDLQKMKSELEVLRAKIDLLDSKLIELFNERAKLVEQVGEWKTKNNKPILDQSREAFILNKIKSENLGPLSEASVLALFQNIISIFRTWENERTLTHKISQNFDVKELAKKKIGILGLGLIGFSIALRLREILPNIEIFAYDIFNDETKNLIYAKDKKIIFLQNKNEIIKCDVIVLATPINDVIDFINNNKESLAKVDLVIDVCSTKKEVLEVAQGLKNFVGGHPLAGKEHAGPLFADSNLFLNQIFVLSWYAEDSPSDLAQNYAHLLCQILGSKIRICDPQLHDEELALTSHMVQLISTTLSKTSHELLDQNKWNTENLLFGPAYREMMRLASSDFKIWNEIIKTNKENIAKYIEVFDKNIQTIIVNLKNENSNKTRLWFESLFEMAKDFKIKVFK